MAAIEVDRPGDGSLRVTINRPEKLNAFTPQMYHSVRNAIRLAELDETIEVVVIQGSEHAFATGADLDALHRLLEDSDPLAVFEFEVSMPFESIRSCQKTTVAAVRGLCLGAGFIIAGLCDVVVATEDARFGLPEGRVGFSDPFAPTVLFTSLPTAYLRYLLLTGERMSADEGWRLGFVSKVAPAESFETTVNATVRALQQTTRAARRNYNKYLNELLPRPDTKAMYQDLLTAEGRAAVARFASRRREPP